MRCTEGLTIIPTHMILNTYRYRGQSPFCAEVKPSHVRGQILSHRPNPVACKVKSSRRRDQILLHKVKFLKTSHRALPQVQSARCNKGLKIPYGATMGQIPSTCAPAAFNCKSNERRLLTASKPLQLRAHSRLHPTVLCSRCRMHRTPTSELLIVAILVPRALLLSY